MIRPHRIHVDAETLKDTHSRIRRTRWSAMLPNDHERYGASLDELRSILEYWVDEYSWRKWEDSLNAVPHFLTMVDGIDLHFWHVRGSNDKSIPLLLLHGWPGAAVEFWNLIGPLTNPAAHGLTETPSFDVIIAELPGFGFSGKPSEPGWGPTRMADAFHVLMHDVLGYRRYAVHGEDWGSIIGTRMARRQPNAVAALQITMPYADPHGDFGATPERDEWEARMYAGLGYDHVQSQVPDALTLGMADSPIGLAAWILEKFSAWSDNDGKLTSVFSPDILVTILNFYWLTSSIISSTRIYRESALENGPINGPPRIPVPAGILVFPKEPFGSPREWLEGVYDVRSYRKFTSGGHFAALEQPQVVLSEIRDFFPAVVGGAK
jgi:microsomal epoxide hydrolase